MIVGRRPVMVGPDGKVPEMAPEAYAALAQQVENARKLIRRKQILYWLTVTVLATLVVFAGYFLAS